ncbi:hypothetical protein [Dactylosporangium sp. NPDC050588]|uniref:hypothetical protein n=1 Tax=Dactylosporangium sp. NPDC050588 TaxID=3157211 RepID=UPI0033EB4BA0
MTRHLRPAVAAVLLAASIPVALGHAAASAGPQPRHAVCQNRACLVLLETAKDRDHDGVADVDEQLAGTALDDPESTPDAALLIDLLLQRKLTSFERHLTELVLLPTLTPDGSAIATGLGEFNLDDHDGKLLGSIGIIPAQLRDNGFDDVFGLMAVGATKKTTPQSPWNSTTPDDLMWSSRHNKALYSDGEADTTDVTDYGLNDQRQDGVITGDVQIGDSSNSAVWTYTFSYGGEDSGRTDKVTETHLEVGEHVIDQQTLTSTDGTGRTAEVTLTSDTRVGENGTADAKITVSQTLKDEDGNVVENRTTEILVQETETEVTTVKRETRTVGGKTEVKPLEVDTRKKDGGRFSDPDYIEVIAVTSSDQVFFANRVNWIRTPAPDTGSGDAPPKTPAEGVGCAPNCPGAKIYMLMDPDGVVVAGAPGAAGFTGLDGITFNPRANPDYDPWLQELTGQTGQPVPVTGAGSEPVIT